MGIRCANALGLRTCLLVILATCFMFLSLSCGKTRLNLIPVDVRDNRHEADSFPDAEAVYLYDIGWVHLNELSEDRDIRYSYPWVYTQMVKILVRTRKAVQKYGEIKINHLDDLLELSGYVQKPDGRIYRLKKEDWDVKVLTKPFGKDPKHYLLPKRTTIHFPNLSEGDVIRYKATQLGLVSGWYVSYRNAPVLFSRFTTLGSPSQRVSHTVAYHNPLGLLIKTSNSTAKDGVIYHHFTARDIPAVPTESFMPPKDEIHSRIQSWFIDVRFGLKDLASCFYWMISHGGEHTIRLKELAAKVCPDAKEDMRTKARRVHDWVKKHKNIIDDKKLFWGWPDHRRPKLDIDKLVDEVNSTNEETASLIWHLLGLCGVESRLVLASPSGTAVFNPKIGTLDQFTNVFIALDDDTLVDTTDRFVPFGMLPHSFEGRLALLLDDEEAKPVKTRWSAPEQNQVAVKVEATLNSTGDLKATAKLVYSGHPSVELRRTLDTKMTEAQHRPWIKKSILKVAKFSEQYEHKIVGLDDVNKPLEIHVTYRVPGYAKIQDKRMILQTRAFADLIPYPSFSQAQRKYDIVFKYLYANRLEATLRLPEGYELAETPRGFRIKTEGQVPVVGMEVVYSKPDDRSLSLLRRISLNQRRIGVDAYPMILELSKRFAASGDRTLVLEKR